MDLPPELRELVYDEFFSHGIVRICRSRPRFSRHKFDYSTKAYIPKTDKKEANNTKTGHTFLCKTGSALLRASRQIHNEAAHILYSKNTFEFLTAKQIPPFIKEATANLKFIRSVTVMASPFGENMHESLATLGECTGLRSLVIRCPGLNLGHHVEIFADAVCEMLIRRSHRSKEQASFLEMTKFVNEKWRDEGEPSQEASQRLRSRIKRKLRLA